MTMMFTLPRQQLLDGNGAPLPGGKAYFYDVGTTDPRTVYVDSGLTTPHTQPVVADANGFLPVVHLPTGPYKVVWTDASDVQQYTSDNLTGPLDTSAFTPDFAKPQMPVLVKAVDYAVAAADMGRLIEGDTTGGSLVFTLPSAVTVGDGKLIDVVKGDAAGTISVTTVSGQTIQSATGGTPTTSYQIADQGDRVRLVSDGANWKALPFAAGVDAITDGSITAAKLSAAVTAQFVQVGHISLFVGDESEVEAGYIICDGRAISRTTYSELYNKWSNDGAVPAKHGDGDGSTTFNVPDWRGLVPRGVDATGEGVKGNDPDAASRTDRSNPSGLGTQYDAGTVQGSAVEDHVHGSTNLTAENHDHNYTRFGQTVGMNDGSGTPIPNVWSNTSNIDTGGSGVLDISGDTDSYGGNETRGKNMAVHFVVFASTTAAAGLSAAFNTVLHGSGAPTDDLGSDGDFYVDQDAFVLWGPKTAGSWSSTNARIGLADGFYYKFSTATADADEGSGRFWLNNATPASATEFYVSETDDDAQDISAWLAQFAVSDQIRIVKASDQTTYQIYSLSGALTDGGAYRKGLTVTHIAGNGTFAADDPLIIMRGIAGPQGVSFNWQGAWTTSTSYALNDGVENGGSSYVCTAPHTSGASTEPGVGASWTTVWDLMAAKGSDGAGSGTVTSVGLATPAEFTVSGSPVTAAGTLTFAKASQSANEIYAGPSSGGAAAPGFRALVSDDIPTIPASKVTGALENIVEDSTPQLGGNLDVNGSHIIGANGDLIDFNNPVNSVNELTVHSAASGNDPALTATGADLNIPLRLDGKGTGAVKTTSSDLDITGNIILSGTVDGRDIATDGTKLDGIEASADVTDAANVNAAGALMHTDLLGTHTGMLRRTGSEAYTVVRDNWGASTDPGVNDDTSAGYVVGSHWINTTADKSFICVDSTNGAAIWTETTAGAGGGISNVVEDVTPQLGGQLDVNGQAIGNGTEELISFTETASAVNELRVTNAATGNGPILGVSGGDTNADLNLESKGTGVVNINSVEAVHKETAGIVLQEVETVDTTNRSTSSTTYGDLSGTQVTITPIKNTNNVRVTFNIMIGAGAAVVASFKLYRNSTDITPAGTSEIMNIRVGADTEMWNVTITYTDSPATTSATTYKLQFKSSNGTVVRIGRRGTDTTYDVPQIARAEEIAA